MSYGQQSLGGLIHVKHGYAFKSEFFRDNGKYVVLTPGHFYEQGGFRSRPDKDRFYDGDIPDGFILQEGTLIVVMTEQGPGLLGSSALVPEGDKFLHNQRIGLVSINEPSMLDKDFLYRLFNTRSVRAQINGSASGTKVRHTAPERICRVLVSIPQIDTQRRIASILAAYDALIDNNRRRIALLDEAARLLFREWFVHFRFPGHEHVRIVDGVPEGWEKMCLGNYAPLAYGKALRDDQRAEGRIPVYGSSGIVGSHNAPLVKGGGIVVGRKGNVGAVHYSEEQFWPIDTTYYIDGTRATRFLFFTLSRMTFMSTDVAVPGLNREFAHSRELMIPPEPLLTAFEEAVAPVYRLVRTLTRQAECLARARDLLLPRMMSGELEV